jgi:phenylalanyl-tRNA synthetase beta chain
MQVSYNLLKEYVDIDLTPEELADRLSMNGIVAEHKKTIFEGIEGVVVGEIKKITPHNQNDNLVICSVDIKSQKLDVVCGAKNMQVGDRVPFAMDSAILPGLGAIREKKIQGFLSKGMICSASELGLEKSKSPGVLILDSKFPIGEELSKLDGIGNDVIFDFEIFSNRPDLMSIIGIAREIAAFSNKKLHIPEIKIAEVDTNIDQKISVEVQDEDLCPRYTGRIVRELQVKESPFWLRWKLFLLGIRPISNIVDVTNFVMMETGQPLHAFDLDYINGHKIIVRRAYPGEIFNTLDAVERKLTEENLVIADQEKAIALAGVMGGENSEIKDYTRDVFLESAYFNPVNNRRTSRYFSLRTDASNRFEKGVDPDGQIYALNRAASLIKQITVGDILTGIIDQRSEKISRQKEITLKYDKVKKVLGIKIANTDHEQEEKLFDLLKRLEFNIIQKDNTSIRVIPPSFRGDIQRDVDIIEEIAKIFGYDKIPSTLFKSTVVQSGISNKQKIIDRVSNILVACGMHQIISYSMITPTYFDWMNLPDSHTFRNTVRLLNPLIQDQIVMRTTLIPGMLKAIKWNINHHKVEEIKLFEVGKVFLNESKKQDDKLPLEKVKVAGAITKTARGNLWEKAEKWDIFYLKGILESVFDSLRIEEKDIEYINGNFPAFDGEKNGVIRINEKEIGVFGKISPKLSDILDITEEIFLFEVDLDVLKFQVKQGIVFKPLPRYPSINRDIAIIIPENIAVDQIMKTISNINERLIQKVELFDIFKGEQIKKGFKSVAFTIIFQAQDRTLTDDEVDKMMENVTIQLRDNFQAELRQ